MDDSSKEAIERDFPRLRQEVYDGEEWMSKLGKGNDIAHRTPESLESECYGKVLVFMKRKAYEV